MDPVSLTASLVTILQLSSTIAVYLKQVKNGPDERIRLREEIRNLSCIIQVLNDRLEDAENSKEELESVRSLAFEGGPFDRVTDTLQLLVSKLAPQGKLRQISQSLIWPLGRAEVNEILSTIERQKSLLSLAVQNDTLGLSLAIKNHVEVMDQRMTSLEVQRKDSREVMAEENDRIIAAWISPLNFWIRHQDVASVRTEGTGEWLLLSSQFNGWVSNTQTVLWCYGMPGAGKTVLASLIIDHLQSKTTSPHIGLAFIYCNYKERSDHTLANLLSSLLRQLVAIQGYIPEEVRSMYQRHLHKQTRPLYPEVIEILKAVSSRFRTVYFVIDALDECSDVDGTRSVLIETLRELIPNSSLLCTSRELGDIEHHFENYPRLEIRASKADMSTYLKNRIDGEPRLKKHVQGDPHLHQTIVDTIVQSSDGMFLLAQLHLSALAVKHTRRALRAALGHLPQEYSTVYEETLQRIHAQNQDDAFLAETVLAMTTFAFDPLKLVELQHAVATMFLEEGDDEITEDDLPHEDIILAVCAGLIIIDRQSNMIRLVHYTTQEFLEMKLLVTLTDIQKRITMTCLTYLSLPPFHHGPCSDVFSLRRRIDQYPFLRYAAQHWGNHARGLAEESCKDAILTFIGNKLLIASALQARYTHVGDYPVEDLRPAWANHYPRDVPPQVVTAKFGLTCIIECLLSDQRSLELGDSLGTSPLIAAAGSGHLDMVKILLRAGGDVNVKTRLGQTALMCASSKGYIEISVELLGRGAAMEQKDFHGSTALGLAAQAGQLLAVKTLLERGADCSHSSQHAVRSGNIGVVKVLVNATSHDKGSERPTWIESALLQALSWRRDSSDYALSLIELGADAAYRGQGGQRPIHLAVKKGKSNLVSLLLSKGIDPNVKNDDGTTPLHLATFKGILDVVKMLISYSADINAENNAGQTAIHTAIGYASNEDVVTLLLEEGIDLNITDNLGRTALHEAMGRGYPAVVELMLNAGADLEAKDASSWSPLQIAAAGGWDELVETYSGKTSRVENPNLEALLAGARLRNAASANEELVAQSLLDSGTDVIPDFEGRTALHHSAFLGNAPLTKRLLERGADVHARIADSAWENRAYYEGHLSSETYQCQWVTPLHKAAGQGHLAIVKMLLDHGADVLAMGKQKYTPLNLAAHHGHADVVKMLIDHGALIQDDVPTEQPTNFYWACATGHANVVRVMLEHGAAAEAGTRWGREALARAISSHHSEIVQLLEEHGFKTLED